MTISEEKIGKSAPVAPTPSRLSSLTSLRFVAAFLVFVYHAHWLSTFADPDVQKPYNFLSINMGYLSVSFFFVLSGFILTWSAKPGERVRSFYRRRFFKIVPSHFVAYAFAFVLLLASGAEILPLQALASLFLVHAWVPDLSFIMNAVSGVTWSLSVEMVFYLLFPVLIVLIKKIKPARLWPALGVVGALVLFMPLISKLFLPGEPAFPFFPGLTWPEMWFLNYGPISRMLEFGTGMILARIVLSGRWPKITMLHATLLTVVVYAISLFLPITFTFAALYPLPIGLLIAAAAHADAQGKKSFLTTKPMVKLGELSFAFFLVHFTLLMTLHAAMKGQWAGNGSYEQSSWSTPIAAAFLLGVLAVSLFTAWLMFRFVETPIMRRWARPRVKPGTTEVSHR